jgi:hypothetical protein
MAHLGLWGQDQQVGIFELVMSVLLLKESADYSA